ncbi:MAG: aldo/keto reductase, partial [Nitrospirota bacterium]|nr:aldo/keto reductase [Nitrospirota bacterium]
MRYIKLKNADITVSRIVFGGWAIGGWYWGGSDEREAIESIHESLEQGIVCFDTAPIYGMGKSERILGRALKSHSDAIIATKCGLRYDGDTAGIPFFEMNEYNPPVKVFKNLTFNSIIYECDMSLKRLERSYIDIYQIHWPDSSSGQEETAKALNNLYERGKIRSAGVCNYSVAKILELKKYLTVPLVSDQERLSLIHRKSFAGNIPFDKKNNLTFLAYSPLAQGLLTNRMGRDRVFLEGDYRSKSEIMRPEFRKAVTEAFS